jgi:fructose-specific phosphotransferase system component IIB
MSDYNSSLPVRTESAGDLIVKIADATVTSQQLKVESDGSINTNATISGTDLDIRDLVFATDKVDVSGSTVALDAPTLAALENITVSATNLDIRDLTFAADKVDASGSTVELGATTLAALETITVTATDLDIRNLVFATDKVDVGGSTVELGATTLSALESITVQNGSGGAAVNIQDGGNSITVDAADLDIRDLTHVSDSVKIGDGTDFLAINSDGSINAVVQDEPGTEVVNYDTTAAVAGGASDNHDFLVTAGGKLFQVMASASGKLRIEVQIETGSATGVFNTIGVRFNSTATPNIDFNLSKYATIPTGARVRVIRRNNDNQAQDVYSTIVLLSN